MSIHRLVIVVAMVVTAWTPVAAGQAVTAQSVTPPKPGTVRGQVTALDTGRPLRRAHITLQPVLRTANLPPFAASTNSRGQYEVKDVPPGSYFVSVGRSGYLTLQYGQRRPGEQGLSVTVRAAAATSDIDVALPRDCVLAGIITDELGEPYPGVSVDALALRYDQGQRVPSPVKLATTDDLGQFRISGLEPGRYYVQASSNETWRTDKGEIYGYASTYFPGGPITQAQVVTVATSEVKSDLHFALQSGRTARITGRVQRETGEVLAGTSVGLSYAYPGHIIRTAGARSTRALGDGSFEFKNVTPGVYSVDAGGGEQTVTAAGADIDGLVLVVKTGSTVTGTIITDEGMPPSFPTSGVRVFLENPGGDVLPTVRVVSVDSDWSFKMTSLGGPFLFRLGGIPDDWMLAAVRLGDKDIADTPWDVPTGGREFKGLQMVVTQKVGRVSGTVLDWNGKPTAEGTVVVFAEDRDLWIPGSRFVRVTRPDSEGRFAMSGLPAGNYRAVVRAYIEDGEWEDVKFLEGARDTAARFVLTEGGAETIALQLPAPAQGK